MHARVLVMAAVSALLAAGLLAEKSPSDLVTRPDAKAPGTWNPKAAAADLDRRADWWMGWQGAARDHGTFCVSCHTALPYALARPVLRASLAEQGPSINERKLIENVTKR